MPLYIFYRRLTPILIEDEIKIDVRVTNKTCYWRLVFGNKGVDEKKNGILLK